MTRRDSISEGSPADAGLELGRRLDDGAGREGHNAEPCATSPKTQPEAQPKNDDVGTNREALAVPQFRRLTAAWVVSNFGDSALYITAAIWVKALTGSDAAAGMVFAALGLPALLAPLTGQLADRFPRRPLLVVNNALAGVIVLLLLLVRSADQLWLIYLVIFLYANTAYVTAAAQSGLLRALLKPRLLAPANGMLSSIDQGLRIVSPLLGAGLFALWGMGAVVLLTAACFGLTALILLTLLVHEPTPEPDPDETFWLRTTAGFRFMYQHRFLRHATLTIIITIAATGVLNVTNFASIEQGVGLPVEFLSVFVSIQGVMSVCGGLTASMVIRRIGLARTMAVGVVVTGLGVSTLATSSAALFVLGVSLVGLGVPWMIVAFVTLRQTATPMRLQGRTSAASNLAFNVPQVLMSVVAAVVIGVIDYRWLIVGAAIACVLSIIPVLRGSTDLEE